MDAKSRLIEVDQLSAEQLDAFRVGVVCGVCGAAKSSDLPFCATDYAALSLPMRLALANPDERVDAFRSAWHHLRLHSERRLSLNRWPFFSESELEAAGFRLRNHTRCEVPRADSTRVPKHTCGARISIWVTSKNNLIALDDATFQPHRTTCVDPEYWSRKRAEREERKQREREARRVERKSRRLQTSARGRRA